MPEIIDDTGAYPVMQALIARVPLELAASGLAPVGYAYMQPGGQPVIDYAGLDNNCGELIVSMLTAYPSTNFPAQESSLNCVPQMAYQLEVALFRCAPNPTGTKQTPRPPTVEAQNNATRLYLADMKAVKRAICKTMAELERAFVLQSFRGYGPEGGVLGGVWPLLVSD